MVENLLLHKVLYLYELKIEIARFNSKLGLNLAILLNNF